MKQGNVITARPWFLLVTKRHDSSCSFHLDRQETSARSGTYGPGHDHRHGDFLENYRLVEALRSGVAPDCDVYDVAIGSSIAVLSGKSVADRSRPLNFPDFTKGRWKTTPPIQFMGV